MQFFFAVFFHHYLFWNIATGAFISFAVIPVGFATLDFTDAFWLMLAVRRKKPMHQPHNDFAVLVPIFNNMRYLRNTWYLAKYRERVVICTTTHETDTFYAELDKVCAQYGFRQHRSELPITAAAGKQGHNPWKIFTQAVAHVAESETAKESEHDAILLEAGNSLSYKYCILLDGDTVCERGLDEVMGEFIARGLDLASVRIVPSKTDTFIQRMQAIEYRVAMDTRKHYPWLTSGACMFAKTKALQAAFDNHSHFFQGGDIEIGKLSRLLGFKVGHLDTEFLTDVPATFKAWFKQRVAWSSGDFRHAIVNLLTYSWRHPSFFVYTTLVVYALMPFRLWFAVTEPQVLPIVLLAYLLLMSICLYRYRSRYLPLLPFYGMFQALIVLPIGIGFYFHSAWKHRNIGIIKLRKHRRGHFIATDPTSIV